MQELFTNFALGLGEALTAVNMFYCAVGVLIGMVVGIIPGVGALAAIALLFPLTFYLEPGTALIMVAGIYYGSGYGGSIAAILLNVPGTPSSAVSCLDGYPMALQGRAGVALFLTAVASFVAGSIGILMMMLFSPVIVAFAKEFGSVEYVALIVLGLIAASTISGATPAKGLASIVIGVAFGCVGMDMYTGVPRFTFGQLDLFDGISLVAAAMGLFGATEVIFSIRKNRKTRVIRKVSWRSMLPPRDDIRRSLLPTGRGSMIGILCGILPGAGAMLASFMSYTIERRLSKSPWRFGKGAIEGLVASEASNNAAEQAAFVPTMTLGIPGSPTMALILGILIINGITPGPGLMTDQPDIFWGLVMSFWIGNLLLLVLNIPLIGLWVKILQVPYDYVFPAIILFVCIGIYSVGNNVADVWMVVGLGALGYVFRQLGIPTAPFILGFVLGPMLEEHFRRAMLLSHGSLTPFFLRPVSAVALCLGVAAMAWGIFRFIMARRHGSQSKEAVLEDPA